MPTKMLIIVLLYMFLTAAFPSQVLGEDDQICIQNMSKYGVLMGNDQVLDNYGFELVAPLYSGTDENWKKYCEVVFDEGTGPSSAQQHEKLNHSD